MHFGIKRAHYRLERVVLEIVWMLLSIRETLADSLQQERHSDSVGWFNTQTFKKGQIAALVNTSKAPAQTSLDKVQM